MPYKIGETVIRDKISRRGFLYGALSIGTSLAIPKYLSGTDEEEGKKAMRVTVCELNNDQGIFLDEWKKLVAHVKSEKSDLVLLPELVFAPWFPFEREYNPETWMNAVKAQKEWMKRLQELAPATVLGTGPADIGGKRLNEAFGWDTDSGYKAVHHKYYVPDLRGFWEASWYHQGTKDFALYQSSKALVGFVICTEIWFFQHSREYGQKGAHLVVCPRATSRRTAERWLLAGRATAIVSGAFSLSSIRITTGEEGPSMGGSAWIVAPNGNVIGQTSKKQPFLTAEIDLMAAERAKKTYPRSVKS